MGKIIAIIGTLSLLIGFLPAGINALAFPIPSIILFVIFLKANKKFDFYITRDLLFCTILTVVSAIVYKAGPGADGNFTGLTETVNCMAIGSFIILIAIAFLIIYIVRRQKNIK